MSSYFIFAQLILSPNQVIYAFTYQKLEALEIPEGLYPQIVGRYIGIHEKGAGNIFSLPLSHFDLDTVVNDPNFRC